MSARRANIARGEWLLLLAAVALALALRVALAETVPPRQAPDEAAHLRYVGHLVREGALPVQEPIDLGRAILRWDNYYNPPLAYLLYVPLDGALARSQAPPPRRVRALRIQNALYGAATAGVAYLVAAALTGPWDPRRLATALMVALVPGFAANTSAVNNDGLAYLFAALLWLPLLGGTGGAWLAGALFGLGCLAKLTLMPLAPLLFLAPLLRRGGEPRRAASEAARSLGVAVLVMLPWLLRNLAVYGDPLAVGVGSISFEWVARVAPERLVEFAPRAPPLKTVLLDFWGVFGVFNQLQWSAIPGLLWPVAGVAALGWLRRPAAQAGDGLARAAPLLLAALALVAVAVVYFSLSYVGGWQGRYLYPAALPVTLLLAGGLHRLLPTRFGLVVPLVLGTLLVALDLALLERLAAYAQAAGP